MNLKEIEPFKIFEVIGGSHAYGTNTPDSDVDLRGIFVLPAAMLAIHVNASLKMKNLEKRLRKLEATLPEVKDTIDAPDMVPPKEGKDG